MPSHLKEKEEKLQHVLECLIEESSEGIPIIVEGKNDVESLRRLGVEGEIRSAKTGGKSQLDLVCRIEESGVKEVIMLLDFDKRGKEWTESLRHSLEKAKIKANLTIWNALLSLAGKEVKDIEGLAAYMETLRRKVGKA